MAERALIHGRATMSETTSRPDFPTAEYGPQTRTEARGLFRASDGTVREIVKPGSAEDVRHMMGVYQDLSADQGRVWTSNQVPTEWWIETRIVTATEWSGPHVSEDDDG